MAASPHKIDPALSNAIVLNAASPGTYSQIRQVADGTDAHDAVNKGQLDAAGGADPFGTVVCSGTFAVNAVTHKGKTLLWAAAGTCQLPAPATGFYCYIKKTATGSYAVTLDPNGAETIDGVAGNTQLTGERGHWKLFSDGTNLFLDLPPTGVVGAGP